MARSLLVTSLLLLFITVSHQAPLGCSSLGQSNSVSCSTNTISTSTHHPSPTSTLHSTTSSLTQSLSPSSSPSHDGKKNTHTITQLHQQNSNSNSNSSRNSKTWKSCSQVAEAMMTPEGTTNKSGIYNLFFGPFTKTSAYCDIVNSTFGWTVILRRSLTGSLLFNKTWEQYEFGFGSLEGEFWYGLDKTSFLTSRGTWELVVELKTDKNKTLIAKYSDFTIHGPDKNYTLQANGHEGVEDFLFQYNTRPFTTFDRPHVSGALNCAAVLHSGWWFTDSCYEDKALILSESFGHRGLKWTISSERVFYVTSIVMKVRQKTEQNLSASTETSHHQMTTNR